MITSPPHPPDPIRSHPGSEPDIDPLLAQAVERRDRAARLVQDGPRLIDAAVRALARIRADVAHAEAVLPIEQAELDALDSPTEAVPIEAAIAALSAPTPKPGSTPQEPSKPSAPATPGIAPEAPMLQGEDEDARHGEGSGEPARPVPKGKRLKYYLAVRDHGAQTPAHARGVLKREFDITATANAAQLQMGHLAEDGWLRKEDDRYLVARPLPDRKGEAGP